MNEQERNKAIRNAMAVSSIDLAKKMAHSREALGRAVVQANCDRLEVRRAARKASSEGHIEQQIRRLGLFA